MIVIATGAEEQHTSQGNAVAPGAWVGAANIAIDPIAVYTGAAAYKFGQGAVGTSSQSSQTATGWWSFGVFPPAYGNGTYRYLWQLGHDGVGVVTLGFVKGATNAIHKVRLQTQTGTYDSVEEFTDNTWHRFKVEFDAGVWTVWASNNGAAWAQTLTRDDSGTYTELDPMYMNVTFSSDEGKAPNMYYSADDVLFWDAAGDNWNSRIGAQDFPRISAAHMPTANGEWDDLDEIPPGADKPSADDDDAYYDCESLKDAPEDYTAETIQALLITRVDGQVGAEQAGFKKFNLYDSGTATNYTDSAEETWFATDGAGGGNDWWTISGYYPWTPGGEENWTEALFNSCEYGCWVLTAYTTQVTVQVIYFGSAHEWGPPAGYIHSQVVSTL